MGGRNLLLSLLLITQTICKIHSFAVSSSNSPKRKKVTNQGKAAGGFAKKDDAVVATHARDESISTSNLINFLLQWRSEGIGVDSDAGSEVGFDTKNGIRGMYATKPFKKNDILCKIPSDVALALTDPSKSTGEEMEMNIANGAVNFLQWYANNEQARQMWTAYLDTLPTRDANFDVSLYLLYHLTYTSCISYVTYYYLLSSWIDIHVANTRFLY